MWNFKLLLIGQITPVLGSALLRFALSLYGMFFESFKTTLWFPMLAVSAVMFIVTFITKVIFKNEGDTI